MQVTIAALDVYVRTKQREARKQVIEIPAGSPDTTVAIRRQQYPLSTVGAPARQCVRFTRCIQNR